MSHSQDFLLSLGYQFSVCLGVWRTLVFCYPLVFDHVLFRKPSFLSITCQILLWLTKYLHPWMFHSINTLPEKDLRTAETGCTCWNIWIHAWGSLITTVHIAHSTKASLTKVVLSKNFIRANFPFGFLISRFHFLQSLFLKITFHQYCFCLTYCHHLHCLNSPAITNTSVPKQHLHSNRLYSS